MATFQLDIITPISKILYQEAEYIKLRTIDGDIGILSNHSPFVAPLVPTKLLVRYNKEEKEYFVSGGFMEISDNTVTILADDFAFPEKIVIEDEKEKIVSLLSEIKALEVNLVTNEDKKEEIEKEILKLREEIKKSEIKIEMKNAR